MADWSLSLDFGTSNTAASIRRLGAEPIPVQLSDSASTMPSAVLLVDGQFRVGSEAVRAARLHPDAFEESPKLRIGEGQLLLGLTEVLDVDLVAAVLRHAARRAVRVAGGSTPQRVVLTHPFDWAGPRRDVLRAAWDRVGMSVPSVVLVSEPVAAASWYALAAAPPPGSQVAVLDIGGGTCDVAVLRVTGDPAQPWLVVGHGGAGNLGGRVVDQILMAHVLTTLRRMGRADIVAALEDPHSGGQLRTLTDQVRQAKHALAEWPDATVPVTVGSLQATVSVTAEELAHLIEPVVSRIRTLTQEAFEDAGVTPSSLHALYLTGGSSHLRPVADMVNDLLGGQPATMDDPKMVVTLGSHRAADLIPSPAPQPAQPEVVIPHLPPLPDPEWAASSADPPPDAGAGQHIGAEQPGAGKPKKRSPWRWAIPVGIAAVVLGGYVMKPGEGSPPPDDPGSTLSATPSDPGSTDPSTPTPTPTPLDELLAVVPASFKDCTEFPGEPTGLDGQPVPGSQAMVHCVAPFTDLAGQAQNMTGWFTSFSQAAGTNQYFNADVPTDIAGTVAACPSTLGTINYRIGDKVVGDVACFFATYDNVQYPTITWTREASGVVGELIGPADDDMSSTWDFWLKQAEIGVL